MNTKSYYVVSTGGAEYLTQQYGLKGARWDRTNRPDDATKFAHLSHARFAVQDLIKQDGPVDAQIIRIDLTATVIALEPFA